MSSADIIVISSPEGPSLRSSAYTCEKLFEYSPQSSSPLSLSPSELFAPVSRSKYFPSPCPRRKTRKGSEKEAGKENVAAMKTKGGTTEDKTKRRRKPADESQTVIEDLGSTAQPMKENVAKGATKPKKSRAINATKRGESGNKTLKGRVAKAGIVDIEQERKAAVQPLSTSSKGQDAVIVQEDDGLHLEGAMTRRLDWTPPQDTSKPLIDLDNERGPETSGKSTNKPGFGNMLSAYNFSDTSAPRDNLQVTGDGGPTKRRRIELVTSNGLGKAPTEENAQRAAAQDKKKPKRPAKKINTLTGRVTALYGPNDRDDVIDEGEAGHLCQPVRRGKAKKANDSEFTVLSPEAATKALDEQDLVFGTCSQLEREESPTSLRDMQMAIHASEASIYQEHRTRSSNFGFGSTRNLWSVAARDSEGSLVQAETLDVFDISDTFDVPPMENYLRGEQQLDCFELESESEQHSIPREDTSISDKGPAGHKKLPISQQTEADVGESGKDTSKKVESCPMPQYSGFTDAELAKQIAAYGFKPLKSRQKMIDLLQKCWEAKHGPSTKSDEVEKQEDLPDVPTTKSTMPGRKAQKTTRSKPKSKQAPSAGKKEDTSTTGRKPTTKKQPKSTTPAPTQAVEVIEDSEEEVIPSPSRLQTRYTSGPSNSQPLPTSTGPSSRTDPSRRTSLPDLATQITKAVRAQPHSISSGRTHPSWHEKILMYDPIVLEDFATWLNTEGLSLVGEDREVSAGFAREWCERRGICCCWKKGAGW